MVQRLALGTVQFGLDYGINNAVGQVPPAEIQKILAFCREAGIDILDTAYAYGQSEERLGAAGVEDFRVVSKLPKECANLSDARRILDQSLGRLGINTLYGLLYHDFDTYGTGRLSWADMLVLQEEYGIRRVGFSFYYPEQWKQLSAQDVVPQIVQLPYNVFDRRFEDLLASAAQSGTEVHIRSTFLQGLFFRDPRQLPAHFAAVKEPLELLHRVTNGSTAKLATTCLRFVLANPHVDRAVIGTDSLAQLQANVRGLTEEVEDEVQQAIADLRVDDPSIIDPSQWR